MRKDHQPVLRLLMSSYTSRTRVMQLTTFAVDSMNLAQSERRRQFREPKTSSLTTQDTRRLVSMGQSPVLEPVGPSSQQGHNMVLGSCHAMAWTVSLEWLLTGKPHDFTQLSPLRSHDGPHCLKRIRLPTESHPAFGAGSSKVCFSM